MERTTSVSFRAKKINVACSSARHAFAFIMSIMIIHFQPAKPLKKIAMTRMKMSKMKKNLVFLSSPAMLTGVGHVRRRI